MEIKKQERNLSAAETVIMKAIWDAKEDIAVPALIELLRTDYGKDYAKTTVVTFLLHLSDKDFITTYRQGRLSYVHALKSEVAYREKLARESVDFWFEGNPAKLVSGLCHAKKFTKKEVKEIREILDGLDN